MSVQLEAQISPHARKFLEENTMRSLLDIPEDALDAVMATAYQLYQASRYPEVEVLCRGLIAADHTYWWSYSLYAATLRRLGRLARGARPAREGALARAQRAEAAADAQRAARGDRARSKTSPKPTTTQTPQPKGERS